MFAIMVIMALATTFITTPLLHAVYSPARQRRDEAMREPPPPSGETRTLIAVSSPQTVPGLVNVGAWLLGNNIGRLCVLHLSHPEEQERRNRAFYPAVDPIERAIQHASELDVPVRALGFISRNPASDILRTAQKYKCGWIVLGGHKGILTGSALGHIADEVIEHGDCNVAILMGKPLRTVQKILVPYLGENQDVGALLAADIIARQQDAHITILHVVKLGDRAGNDDRLGVQEMMDRQFGSPGGVRQVRFQVVESNSPVDVAVHESEAYDLIILGISEQWRLKQSLLTGPQASVAQAAACSILAVHTTASTIINAPTAVVH